MQLIKDLGQKDFGKYKKRIGLYECPICKKHFETTTENVKAGLSKKCKSCAMIIKNTTHGLNNHKLYHIWQSMKERVFNIKDKAYKNYGGRGITVCNEWKNDFMSFYNWSIENGYKEGLSIDRINNDGNYEPLNCRWTTRNIQNRNIRVLRTNNKSGFKGVSLCKQSNKFVSQISVNYKKIHIGKFKTAEEAGYAYDKFVIENNLEHTSNGLFKA